MNEPGKTDSSGKADEPDELAIETARELSPELLSRVGAIFSEDMAESEQEQKIDELLKDINLRANEIYRRKKYGDPD